MASATFHYRAVAADGKLRTGVITAESSKTVARELIRQGLTPVYVGSEEKKSAALKLPSFGSGRRRDVLFFTQELSTLLNSGVPLDRALSITSELTTRAAVPHHRARYSALHQRRQIAGRFARAASRLFLRSVHQHGAGG